MNPMTTDETPLNIGIVSEGMFGTRAYENIRTRFSTRWIAVPFPAAAVVDDLELEIPMCDLYISYARHPDVILGIIEQMRPVILGVTPGLGLVRQAKEIQDWVVSAPTMCSLRDTTGISEIDRYAAVFGLPGYVIAVDKGRITSVTLIREAPCGSTRLAIQDLIGKPLNRDTLQYFGLRICHHCVAPRFGRTCNKELSGILHVLQFLGSLSVTPDQKELSDFTAALEHSYQDIMHSLGHDAGTRETG